jgi:predicted GIY-YIG superfamily endonuclease
MPFWTYMLHCSDRLFYVGHTDDLERRLGQHQHGAIPGFSKERLPVHLVWAAEFSTRDEARKVELQLKGWSRLKKLALIRGDWAAISALAKGNKKERASTSSAKPGGRARSGMFLHPHQFQLPSEPFSLEVAVRRTTDRLRFQYRLTGPIHLVRIPPRAESDRRDNLWQHSCFEAFLAVERGYLELNFSPSTEWAAYRFSGYREGMAELDIPAPEISVSVTDHALELTAEIVLPAEPTRLGLSAVIEETSGTKSYWALRHPPGDTPDFHHPDCFALELPPASGS